MPASTNGLLQRILIGVMAIVFVGLALLALFVAWWIALILIAAWLIYSGVRRLLRGNSGHRYGPASPAASAPPVVIDGEFRVEDSADVKHRPKPSPPPD